MKTRKITAIITSIIMFLTIFPIVATSDLATLDSEASEQKLIAITFDDGPSAYTGQLLDGLRARGAKATFFMNGANGANGTRNHMDLLNRMVNEGHQLANHTYSHHVPFSGLSSAQMASEESAVEEYLFQAMGGSYKDCVRIPGGAKSGTISSSINAPMILWSVDTRDWADRNSSVVYSRIVSGASDGAIVLCHDLYPTTIDAALSAISTLQSQGYEFVTVAELFRRRGVTLSNGSTYNSAPNNGVNLPAYQKPVISMDDNGSGKTTVTLTSPDNLPLYYTTDGSEPNLSSPKYTGPFTVNTGAPVKVRGIDEYGTRTDTASNVFSVDYDSPLFIASYYSSKYSDLKAAYGTDSANLLNHYTKYGINESRQASPIFDINYYMNTYADLRSAFGNNKQLYVDHFNKYGMKEGRRASAEFDVVSYRNMYRDLRDAYGSDLSKYYEHYSKYGYWEHRVATGVSSIQNPTTTYNGVDYSKVYDYNYYVAHNPDVVRALGTDEIAVLEHFVTYGMKEGRQASANFNVNSYKDRYGDLRSAYGNDLANYYLHYINYGYKENRVAK